MRHDSTEMITIQRWNGEKFETDEVPFNQLAQEVENHDGLGMLIIGDSHIVLSVRYDLGWGELVHRAIVDVFLPFKGQKDLTFSGLVEEAREVWELPECQQFARDLGQAVPALIINPDLTEFTRRTLIISECASFPGAIEYVEQPPKERPTTLERLEEGGVEAMEPYLLQFHPDVLLAQGARSLLVRGLQELGLVQSMN